jgi:antitoxin component YwqK of YwqJK toxin-antitoxin module
MLKLATILFTILALAVTCVRGDTIVKQGDAVMDDASIVDLDIQVEDTAGTGPYKIYWWDNSLKAEGQVISSMKNGLWKFYYRGTDGKGLLAEVHYKNNVLDGEAKAYYPNGRLQSKINYKNGFLHGSKMIFYESGMGKIEEYFKDGVKSGKSFEYYENGKIKENAYFRNGLRDGMSTTFYENGKRKAVGRYVMGKKNGSWEMYSEEGKLETRGKFKNDEKTGVWVFYDSRGVKSDEKNYN